MLSEAEAREENVKSLRAIAGCCQVVTLIELRRFSKSNLGDARSKDLEELLDGFSVEAFE